MSGPATPAGAAGRPMPVRRTATQRTRRRVVAAVIAIGWLGLAGVAIVYGGGLLLSAAARGAVLLPRALVWLVLAAQDGADWWSIAGRAAAAVAGALATTQTLWWLGGLALVGAAALFGLHVMLRGDMRGADSEEEER